MQGRTRGFFEDVFVLLVLLVAGWGAYSFFFTEENKVQATISNSTQSKSLEKPIQEIDEKIKLTIQKTDTKKIAKEVTENKINKKVEKSIIETKSDKISEIKKEQLTSKVVDEITNEIEKVDLAKLQKFLIGTKEKIKNKIIIEENNKLDNTLSIRVTVLKNGSFEQFIFVDGNKALFKNNYNNIISIFPLKIDEDIKGDFPRYLRYRFKFTQKEE